MYTVIYTTIDGNNHYIAYWYERPTKDELNHWWVINYRCLDQLYIVTCAVYSPQGKLIQDV